MFDDDRGSWRIKHSRTCLRRPFAMVRARRADVGGAQYVAGGCRVAWGNAHQSRLERDPRRLADRVPARRTVPATLGAHRLRDRPRDVMQSKIGARTAGAMNDTVRDVLRALPSRLKS